MITVRPLVFFIIWAIVSALGQDLLSCEYSTTSPDASGYFHCNPNGSPDGPDHCQTFSILYTNSHYSSLLNLTSYLGINRFALAQANGFSADTESLPTDQPLLIPIECKCNGAFFQAVLNKTAVEGESFDGIAESLEGLTTCRAIREKNPNVSPWDLGDKVQLLIPLRCACPSSSSQLISQKTKFLISYPVSQGDTISNLASKFNVTPETIVSANNNRSEGSSFRPENLLLPPSTLLIPVQTKPALGSLAKPREPNLGFPATTNIPGIKPHKRKSKTWKIGALIGAVFGACIAILAAFLVIQWNKKQKQNQQILSKRADLELQQLGLSIRTTSEKKVSFDQGFQDTLDGQIVDAASTTPRKMLVEDTYRIEELKKATEDFSSSNLIEGSVFHGRLSGKNLAIKRTQTESLLKIEFGLFQDATHHHPNIMRLVGTCSTEGLDSFLVFEYAKNGSLKDWLHGGLAMKSQYISSCYCFLNWNQRLRICLDVATALQYMHQIMIPSYVHRNIKSRNIFLDEEFNAKVGNFGMSRCVEDSTTEAQPSCTTQSAASWSKGYLAPEYVHKGTSSPSIDIFAYGVVLLEVLSGQTPITRGSEKGEVGRSVWLSEKIKAILQSDEAEEELREWMDKALGENYSFDSAFTLANLARVCVEDDPSLRPSAGEIVEKLSRLVEELPQGDHQFTICESSSKPLVKAGGN